MLVFSFQDGRMPLVDLKNAASALLVVFPDLWHRESSIAVWSGMDADMDLAAHMLGLPSTAGVVVWCAELFIARFGAPLFLPLPCIW